MTTIRLAVTILLLLAGISSGRAQPLPNFSGTWVEDESARKTTYPTPSAGGAKSASLPPADTVVTQTGAALTTERKFMSQVVRYVYRLDGKESLNHNGANALTTKSHWEGPKLVTQGTSFSVTSAGESLWEFKESRWIDQSGAMVIETSHKDEAGQVNIVTQLFRRKA